MFFGEVEGMCAIGWKPVCGIGIVQGVFRGEGFESLLVESLAVCGEPRWNLQNESITHKANGGAWMIRERTLPLKGRSVKLVYIARRDNSSTKGESEVKGVFGVGYG